MPFRVEPRRAFASAPEAFRAHEFPSHPRTGGGSEQYLKSGGCEVSVVGESARQTGATHREKGKMIDQSGCARFPICEMRPCFQPFLTGGHKNCPFGSQGFMKLDDCHLKRAAGSSVRALRQHKIRRRDVGALCHHASPCSLCVLMPLVSRVKKREHAHCVEKDGAQGWCSSCRAATSSSPESNRCPRI
jgi:hypothetical protein